MPIELALDSASRYLDWLGAGARLTNGTSIREVRDWDTYSAAPLRVSDWTSVRELPNLLGPDFQIDVSVHKGQAKLDVCFGRIDDGSSDHECPWLARAGRVFIETFAPYGLVYAAARSYKERFHRNLLKTLTPWAKRPSTLPVGTDIDRYVPGLYWMNFFSRSYAHSHGLNVESISRRLRVQIEPVGDGYLLVLFDSPEKWEEHAQPIDQVIRSHSGFFSLDLIPRRVITQPHELFEYHDYVQKQWY